MAWRFIVFYWGLYTVIPLKLRLWVPCVFGIASFKKLGAVAGDTDADVKAASVFPFGNPKP